ncbi:MAG: hypothetical protein ACRD3V_25440, partial [Vicinamibacteria bacterium]
VAAQRELAARAKESKTPWRTVSRTEVFGDTYRFFIATPLSSLASFDEANVHHVTGALAFGGENGFLHVFYVESFAELDKGSPVMRALGPEGAQAAAAKLAGIVSSSELWVARLIPELSFGPPAPTESEPR